MKVLVTGSEGFLGHRLCALLEKETGHEILRYDLQLGHDVLNARRSILLLMELMFAFTLLLLQICILLKKTLNALNR